METTNVLLDGEGRTFLQDTGSEGQGGTEVDVPSEAKVAGQSVELGKAYAALIKGCIRIQQEEQAGG